ncbi:MAG TPA: hypothetical protein VHE99_08835 [Gammaproteobacteria bacterium]|nr:hypothetical protein [Gammaproteobacteria bacterium]
MSKEKNSTDDELAPKTLKEILEERKKSDKEFLDKLKELEENKLARPPTFLETAKNSFSDFKNKIADMVATRTPEPTISKENTGIQNHNSSGPVTSSDSTQEDFELTSEPGSPPPEPKPINEIPNIQNDINPHPVISSGSMQEDFELISEPGSPPPEPKPINEIPNIQNNINPNPVISSAPQPEVQAEQQQQQDHVASSEVAQPQKEDEEEEEEENEERHEEQPPQIPIASGEVAQPQKEDDDEEEEEEEENEERHEEQPPQIPVASGEVAQPQKEDDDDEEEEEEEENEERHEEQPSQIPVASDEVAQPQKEDDDEEEEEEEENEERHEEQPSQIPVASGEVAQPQKEGEEEEIASLYPKIVSNDFKDHPKGETAEGMETDPDLFETSDEGQPYLPVDPTLHRPSFAPGSVDTYLAYGPKDPDTDKRTKIASIDETHDHQAAVSEFIRHADKSFGKTMDHTVTIGGDWTADNDAINRLIDTGVKIEVAEGCALDDDARERLAAAEVVRNKHRSESIARDQFKEALEEELESRKLRGININNSTDSTLGETDEDTYGEEDSITFTSTSDDPHPKTKTNDDPGLKKESTDCEPESTDDDPNVKKESDAKKSKKFEAKTFRVKDYDNNHDKTVSACIDHSLNSGKPLTQLCAKINGPWKGKDAEIEKLIRSGIAVDFGKDFKPSKGHEDLFKLNQAAQEVRKDIKNGRGTPDKFEEMLNARMKAPAAPLEEKKSASAGSGAPTDGKMPSPSAPPPDGGRTEPAKPSTSPPGGAGAEPLPKPSAPPPEPGVKAFSWFPKKEAPAASNLSRPGYSSGDE